MCSVLPQEQEKVTHLLHPSQPLSPAHGVHEQPAGWFWGVACVSWLDSWVIPAAQGRYLAGLASASCSSCISRCCWVLCAAAVCLGGPDVTRQLCWGDTAKLGGFCRLTQLSVTVATTQWLPRVSLQGGWGQSRTRLSLLMGFRLPSFLVLRSPYVLKYHPAKWKVFP